MPLSNYTTNSLRYRRESTGLKLHSNCRRSHNVMKWVTILFNIGFVFVCALSSIKTIKQMKSWKIYDNRCRNILLAVPTSQFDT